MGVEAYRQQMAIALLLAMAALVLFTTPAAQITVYSATPSLTVENASCSTPVTTISFGSVKPPTITSLGLCIKNTGKASFWIATGKSVVFQNLPSGLSGSWTGRTPVLLAGGSTVKISLSITSSQALPRPGSYSFTIRFQGFSTSTG